MGTSARRVLLLRRAVSVRCGGRGVVSAVLGAIVAPSSSDEPECAGGETVPWFGPTMSMRGLAEALLGEAPFCKKVARMKGHRTLHSASTRRYITATGASWFAEGANDVE
jgi:hypothetical protein